MNDADKRFHEQWLGMAQPSEGLVLSLPVLVDAQCAEKQTREAHLAFLASLHELTDGSLAVRDLGELFAAVLELEPARFDEGEALPAELSLYVVEGKQLLRPTRALRWTTPRPGAGPALEATPAAEAGRPYAMLTWEISPEVTRLDRAEGVTGPWAYPAQAKFERLLRECRVPIGLLSNGREVRLVYAPHGESSGWLSFRVSDMAQVSGRPLFDAMVMLLSRERWFGVAEAQQLPALLAESRRRNADVTNELSHQVFEALEELLAGFSAADERDGTGALRAALEAGDDHLYAGLLTVLLRLVFLLYCEDRGLLPTEHPLFAENYSLLGLFGQLQQDQAAFPDTMHRRFGAYPRVVALFRAVYLGVSHGDLSIPARRGQLFDPNVFPFLEGWGPDGGAPIHQPEDRAALVLPSVDDRTLFAVLEKLLFLGGQRLSYKALDVEQIGSVYEALMGFAVKRIEQGAVRIKLGSKKGAARVWVEAGPLLAVAPGQRERWLSDELGFDKNVAGKLAAAVKEATTEAGVLSALEPLSGRKPERARPGALVIQPGPERRRTSSHYTPRELTEPIVARTLEPLLRAMGEAPSSDALLSLVLCDPAVGSGAFLVAACRYLADRVVAAWTREGRLEVIASAHDDVVNHARRLVAQRCLYGVDKNKYAVQLARLSLWLVTMARTEPFTFVDHAIRHGDSLVGLDFDQLRGFHWKPKAQVETSSRLLTEALDEAIGIRTCILDLASEGTYEAQREKERLLLDAEDALDRVRLVGDLVIGAFFSQKTDREREKERNRRLDLVTGWLSAEQEGGEKAGELHAQLRGMQAELRETQTPFHWMIEFPEVFYAEKPDPLDGGKVNGAAFVDAFVGNPPFMGGVQISTQFGTDYRMWIADMNPSFQGKSDFCALFLLLADRYIGHHGTVGMITTNTIGQGDTREAALLHLTRSGAEIYYAISSQPWPGAASVIVSLLCLAKGGARCRLTHMLDGVRVDAISSRLIPESERSDAVSLAANKNIAYKGALAWGRGFIIEGGEADRFLRSDHIYAQILRRFVGGEDVTTHPRQESSRFAIDFEDRSLEESANWPTLLTLLRERVKPERDTNKRDVYRTRWWLFAEPQNALFATIRKSDRALVTSRVSKHLCFAFADPQSMLSESLYVFILRKHSSFAVLQSRIHEPWARLLSSSLEDRLRYAASDCFETFPFPRPDPRAVLPELEAIGERLYEARAKFMLETNQGLTKTYNALKNPAVDEPRVNELRAMHEQMDWVVLEAYGWGGLVVPPYCPANDEERAAVKAFEDEVIDRLFALNAERAAEEARALAAGPPAKAAKGRAKKGAEPGAVAGGEAGAKARGRKKEDEATLALPGSEGGER